MSELHRAVRVQLCDSFGSQPPTPGCDPAECRSQPGGSGSGTFEEFLHEYFPLLASKDQQAPVFGIEFSVPLAFPNPYDQHTHRHRLASKRNAMPAVVSKSDLTPPPQVLHWLPLQGKRGTPPLQFQLFDADYVERLRAGDYRTQENFCTYFTDLIHIKLSSRLKSRSSIEDVRQEVFARFFVNLHAGKIHQPERLGAYVNSMCNNVLLEYYRKDATRDSLGDSLGGSLGNDSEDPTDLPAAGSSPLDILASEQQQRKVREILEKLSVRDRALLRAIFLEDRDKNDVCREFGVDRDHLRVLLCRAKKSFKAWYLKNIGESPPR
jgi:RNA polymerase sigma-70 factor (ECF subfamily)